MKWRKSCKASSEADSVVLFGDSNAHVGVNSETWRGVIGKNGDKTILASATEACGVKRINVTNNVKRSSWWGTPGVKEAVSEKKKAYKLYIQRKDSESRDRYVEARRPAKLAVKAAREEAWKKFGEKLELDYRTANKTFRQTVRRLRGKKSNSIQGVTSKEGNLLTKEEEVLNRWQEYFSELLNPQQGTDDDIPTSKGRKESSPSESEVLYAISKLKDGKAAGIDEIRPEMLKLMGIVGVNWLTRVIKVAWQSGRAPKDWQRLWNSLSLKVVEATGGSGLSPNASNTVEETDEEAVFQRLKRP
ncbi:uncharacterized protein LOC129808679 [Phlebotomus papatasi]|uniref:uncharacterized protein LOC129808679 n=1 Tax=Phlebotomus papatasi TaxID=29031 RepID=UPI00248363E5|nr:uncharacterized protein LOC129808679 [Phlebotomus papatasi]